MAKVTEVQRICRKCWKDNSVITPLFSFVNKDVIKVHQHIN